MDRELGNLQLYLNGSPLSRKENVAFNLIFELFPIEILLGETYLLVYFLGETYLLGILIVEVGIIARVEKKNAI